MATSARSLLALSALSVSEPPLYKECVPLVAQYSNCSKDNICLGCTVCDCDVSGRWNCHQVEKCRPDPEQIIDRAILSFVMENFLDVDLSLSRKKRSAFAIAGHTNVSSEDYSEQQKVRVSFNTTPILSINASAFVKYLTRGAYYPLDAIIKARNKELNDLLKIRDNLLSSVKLYTGFDLSSIATLGSHMDRNKDLNESYRLDNATGFLRRNTPMLLKKYKSKLRRDIHEVLRDITVMRKLSNSTIISHEIKTLIRILNYLYKTESQTKKRIKSKRKNLGKWLEGLKRRSTNPIVMINVILMFLYENVTEDNVLASLSSNSRKVIRRVVNQFHVDEFAHVNVKRKENLTELLRSIEIKWKVKCTVSQTNKPSQLLFKLKLLHFDLSAGIAKLNDIITLAQFAERRRMNLLNDPNTEKTLANVLNDLNQIHKSMRQFSQSTKLQEKSLSSIPRPNKKKSFFQKVKSLLKKSKQDVKGLIKKRVSKSGSSKNKSTEYEAIMQRWQNNLNILPRSKRSPNEFRKFVNRVKNIIPGYLHNKLKPAVEKKRGRRTTRSKRRHHRGQVNSSKQIRHQTETTKKTVVLNHDKKPECLNIL
ncbi:unnamed protein product [Leptosia nina]|uniref:Uncharacterized protein n=1 Tax=Leptosia nina TaxID=320188 RepID=A0AAV1J4Z3_9NEOP